MVTAQWTLNTELSTYYFGIILECKNALELTVAISTTYLLGKSNTIRNEKGKK